MTVFLGHNLSNGRVGLSFASGWHSNDFALAPDNYTRRRELMAEGIDTIRALWRGESVTVRGGDGRDVDVTMYPPPVQRAPKLWITAGRSVPGGGAKLLAFQRGLTCAPVDAVLTDRPDMMLDLERDKRAGKLSCAGDGGLPASLTGTR